MNIGNKLHLPDVALLGFCWGTEHVRKNLRSMLISMDKIRFKRAVLITDPSRTDLKHFEKVIDCHNIEVCDMTTDLTDNLKDDDKNRLGFNSTWVDCMMKYMTDDFSLAVQHDSTIINPELWQSNFLDYDYIAAPWPMHIIQSSDMVAGKIQDIKNVVGNGGFSLRTRKYIEASSDLEWLHKNEDLNTCVFNYDKMIDRGIKFAPPSLAAKFSCEWPTQYHDFDKHMFFTYSTFGFHGDFNPAGMEFINNYNLGEFNDII